MGSLIRPFQNRSIHRRSREWLVVAASLLQLLAPARLGAQTTDAGLFDEETGLWFPAGSSKEAYIAGTAPRAYALDLRARLEADDSLRQEVCDWMTSPRNAVTREKVGQRVMQLRTMAHMVCAGIPQSREARKRQEVVERDRETMYREWLNLDAARKLDRKARALKAEELYANLETVPLGDERVKIALGAIGLKPQDDVLVLAALEAFPNRQTIPGRRFERFLRTLFAAEAASPGDEGARWRLGLRGLLYLSGDFAEARRLTADVLEHPFADQHDYDRVFLAVLDRALGSSKTWDAMLLDCRVPDVFRPRMETNTPPAHYCWTVARELVWRGIRTLGEKTPQALKEILVEGIAAEPTNWGYRMESIRSLARIDHGLARREAEAVLAIPATLTPPGAQFDAVAELARIARAEKDTPRALAAYDRFLDVLGFRLPKVPPDSWERLRAIGKAPVQYEPPSGYGVEDEIRWALGEKIGTAAEAGEIVRARRAVEIRLAAEFELAEMARQQGDVVLAELARGEPESAEKARRELEDGIRQSLEKAAGSVRYYLVQVARASLAAGDRSAALRVAGYLYNQPNEDEPGHVTNLSSLKVELGRGGPVELKKETSPWDFVSQPSDRRVPKRG